MARIGWIWEDLTEDTTLVMDINPNEGASPSYQKQLTKQSTTAPGGGANIVIFEGADQPATFSFSGALLTQEHYEFVYNLWAKRHLLRLTDDLGRVFVLYLESFNPKRVRSADYPWRHTYDASAVVVSGA
ncbi:hypothetical protein [Caudovirales GX15bay]|nr:hypothetical protein [Caudovirales GX15bay]